MFTTTNAMHVLIAGNVARTASASLDPNSASYIADGEVVIVDAAGTVLDSTTVLAKDQVRLAQRSGDEVVYSPFIKAKNIKKYVGNAYATDVEQISYFGFNGTSGAIDVITDNDYMVRVIRADTQATYRNKEMLKYGTYGTGATATEEEVALGLTKSLIANFAREPEREIKFERVASDAGDVLGTGVDNLTFTYGSTLVSASGDIDDATGGAALAVGTYIRVGTAVTDPVYEIVAIDTTANTITLDLPYQGTSQVLADTLVEQVIAADITAGSLGIKMSGLPRKFKRGEFHFSKVRFEITIDDVGTTPLTFDTEANEGNGTWERAQEYEWFASEGSRGKIERIGTPPPTSKQDVDAGRSFSTLYISHSDTSHAGIQGTPESKIETFLLLDKGVEGAGFGGQVSGAVTDIMDVLDAWVVDKSVGTAQVGNL